MSYASGEVNALWRPVDAVPTIDRPLTRARLVGTGDVTDGRFGLFEWQMRPRAGGPAAHFHKTFSESFYVLSGTVRLFNGETWVEATPGDFLHVPERGVHAFRNDSDEPASMLILFAPAPPREEYFRELAEIGESGRRLTPEEWTELYARHDQYMV
ncbi:cupin domain-containing protein [Saccharothrix xinjiangensis]|uniref:Cupin domain-containing protein n=1 Tax=Saccharothrix xinjiangensis TaxID=204798 RepID=A0ABV9YCL2_9PSEU